jgi:voltage-gated potassium channel
MPYFEWPKHGFLGLLLCMVSSLVIAPFFQDLPQARIIINLFFTGVLLFSIVPLLKKNRQLVIIAVILAVPTFLVNWGTAFFPEQWEFFPGIENLFSILFFGYILVVLFFIILRARKITANLIFGSVCIYLLIGLEWAYIYSLLEHHTPGSFQGNLTGFSDASQRGDWLFPQFLYYSYTTLTTLGYGDIAPRSSPAQMISSLEAITGQFYLAVLVARLIGIHLISASKPGVGDK